MEAREYPYTKSILLNAAYDVLERLELPVRFSDSRAGVVRFDCGTGIGQMDFTAILRYEGEVTRVDMSGADGALSEVLFDEIASALYQSFESNIVRRTNG